MPSERQIVGDQNDDKKNDKGSGIKRQDWFLTPHFGT
jgi:hypothetical protein